MFFWDQHKTITSCYELIAKNVCENYQLTLTLCGGDAFHLVPRIIRAGHGSNDRIKRQLGIGLQVSSITMTVFYIILMYVWKYTFPELTAPVAVEAIILISAIIRIVVCILPQNNWCTFHYQKCSLCCYRYRGDCSVCYFRKYKRISYDKNDCCYYYFFWMLSSGYIIQ